MKKIFNFINESRKKILREKIYWEIKKINPQKILDNGSGARGSFDYKEFKDKITKADIIYNINCENLPYKKENFDCVIFAGVIQYVANAKRAMKECARVLKKGGHLIISTISKNSIVKKITGFKDEKRSYTMKEFVNLLEENKFSILKKRYIDFWFIPKKYKMILYCVCKKNGSMINVLRNIDAGLMRRGFT